ncbi:MAG: DUF5048 domain-containing protein, partial [Bacteroidales bacterium]|nr:DUF5048 domain-containing protein [Bacteroidales bacterium]
YHNFKFMGQFQAHGYYEETNANVPYSIPNVGYRIVRIVQNEKLNNDEDCFELARYETYGTTAKQDTISLECMIIPFLEPGQKVQYTTYSTGESDEWIVKSFSWNTESGTMSVALYRFLEDYSYVQNN